MSGEHVLNCSGAAQFVYHFDKQMPIKQSCMVWFVSLKLYEEIVISYLKEYLHLRNW